MAAASAKTARRPPAMRSAVLYASARLLLDARRQQVPQAVDGDQGEGGVTGGLELAVSDETVALRGRPALAKDEAEVLVGLFKPDAVTLDAFVEAAGDGMVAARVRRKRLPQDDARGGGHSKRRDRTDHAGAIVNPVHGLIGEECGVGIPSPGRQRPPARNEHPQIGTADQIDQERRQVLRPVDPVVAPAPGGAKRASDPAGVGQGSGGRQRGQGWGGGHAQGRRQGEPAGMSLCQAGWDREAGLTDTVERPAFPCTGNRGGHAA